MRYGSVCSGIEAATVAWHDLGWTPAWFSEIEPFPCAVLKHHYPTVPNHGDMSKFEVWPDEPIDLLVGGTPCQSFSVAGLRKGLDDPRGNLMLTFGAIAQRFRPEWLVWENVPGVLSSNRGRDFGTFLGMLAELGYGFAYRVLDAQYFGVAQRRRRVFVVANARSWQRAAAVLFERHSLQGHPAPSRKAGQGIANGIEGSVELCGPLNARDYKDPGTDGMNHNSAKMVPIAYPMHGGMIGRKEQNGPGGSGFGDADEPSYTLTAGEQVRHGVAIGTDCYNGAITGNVAATIGTPGSSVNASGPTVMQPVAFSRNDDGGDATEDCAPTMRVAGRAGGMLGVAQSVGSFKPGQSAAARSIGYETEIAPSLEGGGGGNNKPAVHVAMQVRRLTPVECERLQGFPDGYTNIPWRGKPESPDGPRYKALGNSMAVPVMRWIGERIQAATARQEVKP